MADERPPFPVLARLGALADEERLLESLVAEWPMNYADGRAAALACLHQLRCVAPVGSALRAGDRRKETIVDRIYEGLDPSLRRMAQESVLAHLVKLQEEGRARSDADEWELT